ncbi:TPA: head maturation protease, ClpP-related [Pseudomonas aeruginosa]|uniref:head maturation protease, ClpP-related n=3 Tax=Pseudomonas aeruginosa TaxID=287 RepID=UPI00066AD44A|nr:head maturation protease, ClpP-related [Pseudomonas aeruginosa]KSD05988.1 peptidase [Pseudomonas aeruginosa]MCT0747146.1 Clp protease ClpP [Pseudomonas aeruginosa]MDJ1356991.1 Clp protease ClpP [Pseudomonas aeruginosa]WBH95601.1 ATP-dependent Clp protease proteolytic subunit [Pseudomonas aeruginosa]HBO3197141.1 Clp protease ClpP [Pseudomonas aeruginosa]
MTLRNLPAAPEARPRSGVQCDLAPKALDAWRPELRAASGDNPDSTITIYEPIGYDWWTGEGVTAKRIAGALRAIGSDVDVTVNINSPGGDVFEGLAIYNLLREHKGKVTVNIIGLAASAASFIAMAGDEIRIGRAAFLMIHNAWLIAMGNRNDLREIADWLEPFDMTLADIYAQRTGIDIDDIVKQMDAETWIGGREAVDKGWADAFLESDEISSAPSNRSEAILAKRRMDAALARSGMPRSQRNELINDFKTSMLGAAGGGVDTPTDMPGAVAPDLSAALRAAQDITKFLQGESQ